MLIFEYRNSNYFPNLQQRVLKRNIRLILPQYSNFLLIFVVRLVTHMIPAHMICAHIHQSEKYNFSTMMTH